MQGRGREYEHKSGHNLYTRHIVTTFSTKPSHENIPNIFKIEGTVALTIEGR